MCLRSSHARRVVNSAACIAVAPVFGKVPPLPHTIKPSPRIAIRAKFTSTPLKDKKKIKRKDMNKKFLKLLFDVLKYILTALAGYFCASCSIL